MHVKLEDRDEHPCERYTRGFSSGSTDRGRIDVRDIRTRHNKVSIPSKPHRIAWKRGAESTQTMELVTGGDATSFRFEFLTPASAYPAPDHEMCLGQSVRRHGVGAPVDWNGDVAAFS